MCIKTQLKSRSCLQYLKAVRELEKFKALSKGKKTAVIVGAVAIVVAVALLIYFLVRPEPGTPVTLVSVQQGDIQQELIATGTVESDNQTNFNLLEGTKVLSVNVKVGDHVKKGDVLATFDASSLSGKLSERRTAYNEALKTYNNSLTAASEAKTKLPQVNKEIKALEAKIGKLTKEANANKTTQSATSAQKETTEATTTPNTLQGQIQAIVDKLIGANGSAAQIQKLMEQLTQMANNGFDMSALAGSSSTELIQAQMDLAQLKIQKTTLEAQQSNTLSSTYKLVVDASKKSLDEMESMIASLKSGWVAQDDGVVTAVNIKAGETYQGGGASSSSSSLDMSAILKAISGGTINSLLNTLTSLGTGANVGMTVENYGQFYASFSLDKYDVLKIKTGMPAVITTASGELSGEVSFISPVASSGGGLDLSSLAGTLTGVGTSSSIPAKVKINNPDASVIIGVDVDVSIQTDEAKGATLIPLESLMVEEGQKYVFVYNKEEKTVSKKKVETGLVSDTMYQIISGVSVGDQIVKSPSKTLMDGARVTIQEEGESVSSSQNN